MTTNTRRLPLFPLNTVLFPGASLPLQIFEERYKLMLRECMESDSKFGVSLIREGTEVGGPALPHDVGTVAHLVQVSRIEGDRFFVAAVGQRRFRVSEITQWTPFVAAEVELLDEGADENVPDALIEETTGAFSEYARISMGMAGGWVRQPRVPKSPARALLPHSLQHAARPAGQAVAAGAGVGRKQAPGGAGYSESRFGGDAPADGVADGRPL